MMIKVAIIVAVLLAGFCFAWIVATATPTDAEAYEEYMRWKERQKDDRGGA